MSYDEVARFRSEIGEVDRELLDAVNRRLELVRDLKRYKEEHGIAFLDASARTRGRSARKACARSSWSCSR
jgi:chorismate mutase